MDKKFQEKCKHLIENFIIPRGVQDPATIKSMMEVPRHRFVPPSFIDEAYRDYPLSIGAGQTISQPYIVALMTQSAELTPDSVVLEIGTGSGYQAAILSRIVNEVYTVERIPDLGIAAENLLKELKYDNVHVRIGDGTLGWPEKSPFDVILVTAGAPIVPHTLVDQLKIGGRLIIPVGDTHGQRLLRIRKISEEEILEETLQLVRFVPLIGQEGWTS